jgi:1,4-dihydroxy-2-naphthoyl-CoA hydrolase
MPEHFGIRITDAAKDKLVGELDVDDRHLNNSGHVHGGALAAFADDLGGRLAGLNVTPVSRPGTQARKTFVFDSQSEFPATDRARRKAVARSA